MKIRRLDEARKTGRRITSKTWESTRMALRDDNMGFSFHITTIYGGTETHMHYRNHLEAVYCISGEGEIEDKATGEVHQIAPGTLYLLDQHDAHVVRARTDLELACVFDPPLFGTEVHDESGAYPVEADTVAD